MVVVVIIVIVVAQRLLLVWVRLQGAARQMQQPS